MSIVTYVEYPLDELGVTAEIFQAALRSNMRHHSLENCGMKAMTFL